MVAAKVRRIATSLGPSLGPVLVVTPVVRPLAAVGLAIPVLLRAIRFA